MFDNAKLEKAMQLLKQGDRHAFDTIYEQTHRMVYYIVYSVLKDHGRSEDVTQNVFIRLYEKIELYDKNPNASAKAWIGTIAKNLALNDYKKYKNDIIIDPVKVDYLEDKVTEEDTPLIDLASAHLPEDEFTILMLCVVEGYKRREVGAIMDLSTSGVTWKLEQALSKLRKLTEGGI